MGQPAKLIKGKINDLRTALQHLRRAGFPPDGASESRLTPSEVSYSQCRKMYIKHLRTHASKHVSVHWFVCGLGGDSGHFTLELEKLS